MIKVKICGITDHDDAAMAVRLGADALGFIFAPSPRQITPARARDIICGVSPFVKTVGVFVDEDLAVIRQIRRFCGLDMIQLHGNETPEFCRELMPLTIKAFRLRDESSLGMLKPYSGCVRALLLDTYQEGKMGGTGKTFDWSLALSAKGLEIPLVLSGGLNPSNIRNAVSKVRPYAVDVNSGIEERPGKKSPFLMKKLMETIKRTEAGRPKNDR